MAMLGSRRTTRNLGEAFVEYPNLSAPYLVITNGFWKEESFFKNKPKVGESIFPIDDLREQLENISIDIESRDRQFRFTTNQAGMDQANQALIDEIVRQYPVQPVQPEEAFEDINYWRTGDGFIPSGEAIINSDSVSIVENFTLLELRPTPRQLTEEETIQLLDQISRDDI